jgi:curved DNA-binding protein CbpA
MRVCVCGNLADQNGTTCHRCNALQELGLRPGAADADVKAAYRLYVKAWHPDRFPGDEKSKRAAQEKLKTINSAYDFLTSPYSKQGQPYTPTGSAAYARPQAPYQKPNASREAGPRPPSSSPLPPQSTQRRRLLQHTALALLLISIAAWVLISNRSVQTQPPSDSASTKTYTSQRHSDSSGGTISVPKGLTPISPPDLENPARTAFNLPNGTELRKRRHLNGHGELTVENGTSFDAVIHLVDLNSEKTIRTFYVDTGSTFIERQIAPGLYGIYFATGSDWDAGLKTFNSSAGYSQFGRNLEYSEKPDPDNRKIEYSTYQITLQPVQGGNAATYPSDKDAFNKLMNDGNAD